MRLAIAISLLGFPCVGFISQAQGGESIEALVKKLGSANFKEREGATAALKKRPDAAPQLKLALKSADVEIRTRVAEILDYFNGTAIRELNVTVKEGRAERFIEMVETWPAGKDDDEVWESMRAFARTLRDRHVKQGGRMFQFLGEDAIKPKVLCANKITLATKVARSDALYFLRANEVDLARSGRKPAEKIENDLDIGAVIVAGGNVRLDTDGGHLIIARGSVEITGPDLRRLFIVSGGDIHLKCKLYESLIIARGVVTCSGEMEANRVICGKSFDCAKIRKDCIVTENELNPLGFIRWSDPPKAEPKRK